MTEPDQPAAPSEDADQPAGPEAASDQGTTANETGTQVQAATETEHATETALFAGLEIPLPARAAQTPSSRTGTSSPWWRVGYPIAMVLLLLAIPALVLVGRNVILTSTEGKRLTDVTDPSLPGWEAITEPTPTMLVAQTGAEGQLVGVTVLVLTGEGVGAIVFVPPNTAVQVADEPVATLSSRFASGGMESLRPGVEAVLGTGMGATTTLDDKGWTDLTTPTAPLTVDNPSAAGTTADGGVRFPKGTISLPANEVGPYLAAGRSDEDEFNRLARHQAFWKAWLNKVAASDNPNVVPGETETGLGRFVRTLAVDRVDYHVLPVRRAGIPGTDAVIYAPEAEQVATLVATIVPFPVGAPPGSRARVRILDGTGQLDHGLPAAPLVVQAGGQVDQIGNATSFTVADTQIVYYDDARKADADNLRAALGTGTVVQSVDQGDAVDITVILGADYLASPRAVPPVTATPSGTAAPAPGPGGTGG